MPRIPRDAGDSPTGAPAFPFSDNPSDREHDADGLYAIGPKRARDPIARMIADRESPFTGGDPAKARYETVERPRLIALRRLAAAVAGKRTRNRTRAA
jgi:hypothetical protein